MNEERVHDFIAVRPDVIVMHGSDETGEPCIMALVSAVNTTLRRIVEGTLAARHLSKHVNNTRFVQVPLSRGTMSMRHVGRSGNAPRILAAILTLAQALGDFHTLSISLGSSIDPELLYVTGDSIVLLALCSATVDASNARMVDDCHRLGQVIQTMVRSCPEAAHAVRYATSICSTMDHRLTIGTVIELVKGTLA
jgi:hypothetical protein